MLETFKAYTDILKSKLNKRGSLSVDVFEVIDLETDSVSSFVFIPSQKEFSSIKKVHQSYTLEGDVLLFVISNERLVNITDKVLLHASISGMEVLRDNVKEFGFTEGYNKTKEAGYL